MQIFFLQYIFTSYRKNTKMDKSSHHIFEQNKFTYHLSYIVNSIWFAMGTDLSFKTT